MTALPFLASSSSLDPEREALLQSSSAEAVREQASLEKHQRSIFN
jgi:hypothetical protein